jgi:hypothetical protein
VSTAEARGNEVDVVAAVVPRTTANAGKAISVRGYVFNSPYGLRLCKGKRSSSPPSCVGPWLDLTGVDRGSFNLKSARVGGQTVLWLDEPVSLRGQVDGPHMTVEQVLS